MLGYWCWKVLKQEEIMIIFSSVTGCRIAKGHRSVTKERGTMAQDLERNGAGLPIRELGKTGLKVSIVGFGRPLHPLGHQRTNVGSIGAKCN